MKNFLSGQELSPQDLQNLISHALEYKKDPKAIPQHPGKILLSVFFNKSLRTQVSFAAACAKMAMTNICLQADSAYAVEFGDAVMHTDKPEHIAEMMAVLSRYADILAVRQSNFIGGKQSDDFDPKEILSDYKMQSMGKLATKPLINMESEMHHPCQGLADAMTIAEYVPDYQEKTCVVTWVPHIKTLPYATPQSQIFFPHHLGMKTILACPQGYELPIAQDLGIEICHDQDQALKQAHVVIAKSWMSHQDLQGQGSLQNSLQLYPAWTVTEHAMAQTQEAILMHCLPMRRGVEIAANCLTQPYCKIIDEAENRMWAQMAVIHHLLTGDKRL